VTKQAPARDLVAKTVVVERALDLTRAVKPTKTAETRTVDLISRRSFAAI
jgi:hypothetical protein